MTAFFFIHVCDSFRVSCCCLEWGQDIDGLGPDVKYFLSAMDESRTPKIKLDPGEDVYFKIETIY